MSNIIDGNITTETVIDQSADLISKIESGFNIPKGYLKTHLALHLPLFELSEIFYNNKINRSLITSECLRLAARIEENINSLPWELKEQVLKPDRKTRVKHIKGKIYELEGNDPVNEIRFGKVDENVGLLIQSKLHYILNPRYDTLYHFGLFRENENFPFAYAAYSPLDRTYIQKSLPIALTKKQVLVFTRGYNINNSPSNAMSLMISQSLKEIHTIDSNISAVVSAINPNVLFKGTIFKGSDFKKFAEVPFVPQYYKGVYLTRKTFSRLSRGKINRTLVEKKKFKLVPVVWMINFINNKRLKKPTKVSVKKITYDMYERG